MSTPQIDDVQIAEAAFHLWLSEGQPEGRAEAHWYQARTDLLKAQAPAPKNRRAAAKPKAAKAPAKAAAKPRAKRKTAS